MAAKPAPTLFPRRRLMLHHDQAGHRIGWREGRCGRIRRGGGRRGSRPGRHAISHYRALPAADEMAVEIAQRLRTARYPAAADRMHDAVDTIESGAGMKSIAAAERD